MYYTKFEYKQLMGVMVQDRTINSLFIPNVQSIAHAFPFCFQHKASTQTNHRV